jgi:hypothetical protein
MEIDHILELLAKKKELVVPKDQVKLILQLLKMIIIKHSGNPTNKKKKENNNG